MHGDIDYGIELLNMEYFMTVRFFEIFLQLQYYIGQCCSQKTLSGRRAQIFFLSSFINHEISPCLLLTTYYYMTPVLKNIGVDTSEHICKYYTLVFAVINVSIMHITLNTGGSLFYI